VQSHRARVGRIARSLKARSRRAGGRPLKLRKRAVSHQVPKAKRGPVDKLDVGDLDRVLAIDDKERVCVAEPGVTFADLVDATLARGLVPMIVPELKTITLGGAIAGCSIESSSFRFGGFHDTCLAYEVITARGEVLHCTPRNRHSLVFQMVHGTFGTVGIISKIAFRLMPARQYVKVTYERFHNLESYMNAIQRHYEAGDLDFMDGIIHSPELFVLCGGRFVDEAPYTNRYDWMKIYYLSTRERSEDYLATRDYYFRYDKGVTNVHPRSFVGRLLFGKWIGSTQILRLAERLHWLLPSRRPRVTVDVFIPFSRWSAFEKWYEAAFGHFPLWCVPYRVTRKYEWIAPRVFDGLDDSLFLDIAIYGMKQRGETNYYQLMEDKLRELNGLKTLISHNYYSEDAFWQTWNRPSFQAAKSITDPENLFGDLYRKTCRR